MKNPKKLSLARALKATSEPLVRFGDLIYVIYDEAITGNSDHQWRPTFAPSMDRSVTEFPQPATEEQIRGLYAAGGWLESVAHYTDEELALSRDYLGGFMRAPGCAGDLGDASAFEKDCKEVLSSLPPEYLDEDQRAKTWEIVRRTLLHQHMKYKLLSNLGNAHQRGRSIGGKKAARSNQDKAKDWHSECVSKANTLLAQGKSTRELAGILSAQLGRSARQVHKVLKKAEVK